MNAAPHYPGYDVLRQQEEWDGHTREIVARRLDPPPPRFLNRAEARILAAVVAAFTDYHREDLAAYAASEIDGRLAGGIGEAQREPGTPPEAELIRRGLAALEETARNDYGRGFPELDPAQRRDILGRAERGELPESGPWLGAPPRKLARKLLELAVETCYSFPDVWSEIGYGGPAYPRGYVRIELGLADPWEPRRKDEDPPAGETAPEGRKT